MLGKKPLILLVLSLLLVCLCVPLLAFAQDETTEAPPPTLELEIPAPVTPEPTLPPVPEPENPSPPETEPIFEAPTPDNVLNALFTALAAALSAAIASPLTATVVSVLKRFPPFSGVEGSKLNLGVAVVLSVFMWGATALGYGAAADTVYQLIYAVLPILAAVGGNFLGNKGVYRVAEKNNLPIVGYQRTPQPARVTTYGGPLGVALRDQYGNPIPRE